MDKKSRQYLKILTTFLEEEVASRTIENIDYQLIIDKKNGHYQLMQVGWVGTRFLYDVLYHFQVKIDGKIWLLANNTEFPVAEELVKQGIPATSIVIAFHPIGVRPMTGFAVQ